MLLFTSSHDFHSMKNVFVKSPNATFAACLWCIIVLVMSFRSKVSFSAESLHPKTVRLLVLLSLRVVLLTALHYYISFTTSVLLCVISISIMHCYT